MPLISKQFLFIVGSPRSGTTMLQVLLGSHPQVATSVELTFFDEYVATWLERWAHEKAVMDQYGFRRGLPTVWTDADMEGFLLEFLTRAYSRVIERAPGRTHVLDKNPHYSGHVHLIKRLLPGARFIHMVRDGRDVACSLRAATAMGFRFQTLAEAGTLWRDSVLKAREAAVYTGDYLELRYEDFLGERTAHYEQVLEFCGLRADSEWIARTLEENTFEKMKDRHAMGDPEAKAGKTHYQQGQAGRWQREFTPGDRYAFDRIAGPLLRELGYAKSDWWAEGEVRRLTLPLHWEARRRWKLLGLGLTLARRAVTGAKLPAEFAYFDR